MADWVRVLKPGGLLVLELPCLDKILRLFAYFVREKKPIDPRLTVWGLYGDPRYENEAMTHKWCYSVGELRQIMEIRPGVRGSSTAADPSTGTRHANGG